MEGSVDVDNGGSVPQIDTTVGVDTKNQPTNPGKDSDQPDVPDQGENRDENDQDVQDQSDDDNPELTEKGTKRDPNPQSAVHQDLANANRTIAQYQQVLENPKLLAAYAKEMGLTIAEAKEEIKDRQEDVVEDITPDKLKTAGDVAKILNDLKKQFGETSKKSQEEIARLTTKIERMTQVRELERVSNSIASDIASMRSKYPELDPKLDADGKPTNPIYNPELEKAIGSLYQKLDFDEQTRSYRGNISLAEVAENIMTAAGIGKKKGSQEAQTVIQERKNGRIITGNKQQGRGDDRNDNPATTIAARISKVMGK